ncbi:trans-sialidase, putative [Trypanosoma cruzi marinkellei]|uniref:Trans-sialidase, putative n=1 Tax=Trypanosoma cruzi marinkellei TaxID=85056 RepID=K2NAQ3_TRYCR|nr:trans-sialidase, putative [Trypanosoma cruzi marinkellei]
MQSGNEKLISVYENEKGDDGPYSLVAVRLRVQLGQIKSMGETWAALDSAFQSCRCVYSGTVDPIKKGMCNGPVPTKGLVGFLSGNFSENTWRDEYLCVNAIVHGPVEKRGRVPNGWTFKGSGAWAEWPVGDMGPNQPYYFSNNEFSLVATVSIHEVPKESSGPIPFIGVRMNDTSSSVFFGLSYTHDKKWRFTLPNDNSDDSDYYEDNNNWQPNKTHQLILQMNTNEWYVYFDGMQVYDGYYMGSLFDEHRILHFYFGAENKEGSESSYVTVSNVLLYKRIFFCNEISLLNASKFPIPNPCEETRTVPESPPKPHVTVEATPVNRNEEHPGSHAALGDGDSVGQNASPNNVLAPEAPAPSIAVSSAEPEGAAAAGGAKPFTENEKETPPVLAAQATSPEGEEASQERVEETAQEV